MSKYNEELNIDDLYEELGSDNDDIAMVMNDAELDSYADDYDLSTQDLTFLIKEKK